MITHWDYNVTVNCKHALTMSYVIIPCLPLQPNLITLDHYIPAMLSFNYLNASSTSISVFISSFPLPKIPFFPLVLGK